MPVCAQPALVALLSTKPAAGHANSLDGWGEDGRIVWMLRTLGHEQSHLVNGGVAALLEGDDLSVTPGGVGDFTVARTDAFDISKDELAARLDSPGLVILDTREPREYAGDTPYGETRGGHVPGAQSVYFQDLVDENGRTFEGETLRARLASLGIAEGSEVVS